MEKSTNSSIVDPDENGFGHRLLRLALVVYLSPVIVAVFAVGLIGIVATNAKLAAVLVSFKGTWAGRETARPLDLVKTMALDAEVA